MMTTATTVVVSAASLTTCALISIHMKREKREKRIYDI